jgi:CRISPR type III-B/RAMP module RAMP protein Cmr6
MTRPGPPGRPGPAGRPGSGRQRPGQGGPPRPATPRPAQAAGPLGRFVAADSRRLTPSGGYRPSAGAQFGRGASALILLHRVAFFDRDSGRLDDSGQRALLRWAAEHGLGQDHEMVAAAAGRRDSALANLRRQGQHVIRLRAVPEWRLAAGLGNKANAHEIGLSLHGTYGWPVLPASSLKGLTAAWAATEAENGGSVAAADIRRVLGTPRKWPAAPAAATPADESKRTAGADDEQGTVRFLDAIPAGEPAAVSADVLTPHVKPYYETTRPDSSRPAEPPAEYHNPVPVNFLAVSGAFAVDLYGPVKADVKLAARWLTAAADELGAGGKTAAGYGFLTISRTGEQEGQIT